MAINWDDYQPKNLTLDFVEIGATDNVNRTCDIYDLWTGDKIGSAEGKYDAGEIGVHDNVSIKLVCEGFDLHRATKRMEAALKEL